MHMLKQRQPIQQLSRQLANQIAAGEVVERPASVVKELLENSLDAGASQIDIELSLGGTQSIRIRDNGCGIPQEELLLALAPHATSKIQTLDDLMLVESMGFRGEALASIDSVSECTLTSRPADSDQAWSVLEHQSAHELRPASHPVGTTVEVNNLFYNTPARRKFLRSDRTEYRHVEDIVKRVALSHFNVGLNLKHNQRQVMSLVAAKTAEARIQRLKRVLGQDFLNAAIEIDFSNAGLRLWGWIAAPQYSRSQSDMQYFFVNGRMIRDKVITHAVRQAYKDSLYPGRFPVYVLHLEMDPEQVDVNVHPTKHEVRFRQARMIHDFLFYSIHEALQKEFNPANTQQQAESALNVPQFENKFSYPTYSNKVADNNAAYGIGQPNHNLQDDITGYPLGAPLTVIEQKYLVAQNSEGLLVLDIQAAQQKYLTQYFRKICAKGERLVSQPVLIPYAVTLGSDASTWLKYNEENLLQLGFTLTVMGEREIMVRQLPVLLKGENSKQLVTTLLKDLSHDVDVSHEQLIFELVNGLKQNIKLLSLDDCSVFLRNIEQLDQQQDLYFLLSAQELASKFKTNTSHE